MSDGLSVEGRPLGVIRFETFAGMAIVFGLLSSLIGPKAVWIGAFGLAVVQMGLVCWTARYRSRAGRLIWSGLLLIFAFLVVVGFVITIHRGINIPAMSGLDVFLSIGTLGCNAAAALFLWSEPTSKWLGTR
jgi:hypothetical protein